MPSDSFGNKFRKIDWSDCIGRGVIIDLQVKRYRGMTKLTDIPLDSSNPEFKRLLDKYVLPNQKVILPSEMENRLKTLEVQARQNLISCSFSCDSFSTRGRFVPYTSYHEFKAKNEEYRQTFYEMREEYLEWFSKNIDSVRSDYLEFAKKSYRIEHPHAVDTDADFRDYIEIVLSQLPDSDDIRESFRYNTYLQRMPNYLLDSVAQSANERSLDISSTIPPRVAERAAKVKKAEKDGSESPLDIEKMLSDDIEQSTTQQSESMSNSFVEDIVTELRRIAISGATQIVVSIDKNGNKFVGRASMRAHSLVDELRRLDFYGDAALQSAVDRLAYEVDIRTPRNVGRIKQAALSMIEWARDSIWYIENGGDEPDAVQITKKEREFVFEQSTGIAITHNESKPGNNEENTYQNVTVGTSAKTSVPNSVPSPKTRKSVSTLGRTANSNESTDKQQMRVDAASEPKKPQTKTANIGNKKRGNTVKLVGTGNTRSVKKKM